jgi:hypothetical protein
MLWENVFYNLHEYPDEILWTASHGYLRGEKKRHLRN